MIGVDGAISRTHRLYVDPVAGNDVTGKGTKAAPYQSIGAAVGVLSSIRKIPGIVFVKALDPAAPISSSVSVTVNTPITLAPWGAGRWHLQGGAGNAYALRVLGTSTLTILRGHVVGSGTAGIRLGDTGQSGGKIVAYDTYAEGGDSGWQTAGVWQQMDCHRCQGLGHANDGFNIHGDAGVHGVANLYDCWATGCGDEGVSPHDDTILNLYGFTAVGNGGGGMQAVNNAVANIYKSLTTGARSVFIDSHNDHVPAANLGYYDAASGVIDGATVGNPLDGASNYRNDGTGTVTLTDLITN